MTTEHWNGGGVWFATADEAIAAGSLPLTSASSRPSNWKAPGPHGPRIVYHRNRRVAVWRPDQGVWVVHVCACRIPDGDLGRLDVHEYAEAFRYCSRVHNPLAMKDQPQAEPTRDHETALRLFPILRFFDFDHLPDFLRKVSEPFCTLAWRVARDRFADQEETGVALRKLLEAKDAAVRGAIVPR